MFMAKEELPVQITEIDGIEIDDVYFAEACKDEILQQLAADAACADEKNPRLQHDT